MTPLQINIFLHVYTSGMQWSPPSVAADEAFDYLVSTHVIRHSRAHGSGYVITNKGEELLERLTSIDPEKIGRVVLTPDELHKWKHGDSHLP